MKKIVKKILNRILCLHTNYYLTGETLGCKLHKWKCAKCGKEIYRDKEHSPINMLEEDFKRIYLK